MGTAYPGYQLRLQGEPFSGDHANAIQEVLIEHECETGLFGQHQPAFVDDVAGDPVIGEAGDCGLEDDFVHG